MKVGSAVTSQDLAAMGLDGSLQLPSAAAASYEGDASTGTSYDDADDAALPYFVIEIAPRRWDDAYVVEVGLLGSSHGDSPLRLLSVVGGYLERDSPGEHRA